MLGPEAEGLGDDDLVRSGRGRAQRKSLVGVVRNAVKVTKRIHTLRSTRTAADMGLQRWV